MVVIVVGSANVDWVLRGDRIPAPGETVVMDRLEIRRGGKGANQAAAAAALGVSTHFVGVVGDDDNGRLAVDDLRARGVDVDGVTVSSSPTGIAVVLVDASGENAIAVVDNVKDGLTPDQVRAHIGRLELRSAGRGVLLATLEPPVEIVEAASRAARDRGMEVVIVLAPARDVTDPVLELSTLVLLNEPELRESGGATTLLDRGARMVLETRGAEGARLHRRGGPIREWDGLHVESVDSHGAGDAFAGALAAGLAEARALDESISRAIVAGAIAVEEAGARDGFATREALELRISDSRRTT